MFLLSIDTSAHQCAVNVSHTESESTLSQDVRDIGRGHAEILMQQIQDCLNKAELKYSDLSRIGVVKGPGSFTGLRVGLAAARGLGLSLGVDVVGISALCACETAAEKSGIDGKILTILDARRDQAYCKYSGDEHSFIDTYENIAKALPPDLLGVCGSGAPRISKMTDRNLVVVHELSTAPIEIVAELARVADAANAPPEPLYLRSADAKPQTRFTLEMQ